MLGALIDLSADNTHQATVTFLASWEREPGSLSKAQIRFLRAFARHDSIDPQDANRVLDLLKQKSSELDELRALIPIMFRLALRARDTQTAIAIIDRALVVDEQNYFAAQPGAAEHVSSGRYKSGLDHYVRSGEAEDGSDDFTLLHELKSALQALLGVEIPIVSLRPYVVSLAQGHVATTNNLREPLSPVASTPPTSGSGLHPSRRITTSHTSGARA